MKKVLPKSKSYTSYEKWFENLPMVEQMLVAQYVSKKIDKIHEDTTEILDSCYIGAMIEVLEMDLDQCIQIARKANENMQITQKTLNSEGNEYYMKVNNNTVREQIKEEAKAMLKSNPKESTINISRELEKEYKMPLKDLHIIVSEARKDLKEEIKSTDTEKEKFMNKIGQEQQEILNKEVAADKEEIKEHNEKVLNEIYSDAKELFVKNEDSNQFKVNNRLKIKSIEIQGEHGTYKKDETGVKTEKIFVKDLEDLANYREAVSKEYNKGKNELLEKMKEIQEELNQLENRANKNFRIIEEIEQVFNIN